MSSPALSNMYGMPLDMGKVGALSAILRLIWFGMEVGEWLVKPAAAAAAAAAAADPRAAAVKAESGVGGKPMLPWLLKLGR